MPLLPWWARVSSKETVPFVGKVRQDDPRCIINDNSAHRYLDFHIGSLGTCAVFGRTIAAAGSNKFSFIAKINKGIEILIGYQINTPTASAVTAVRTAVSDKFLTPKTGSSVAAASCFYIDPSFIRK